MKQFNHRFQVNAPLEDVVEFHRQSASMGAITPPPVIVRVHKAPPILAEGDIMDFTLWVGPLPIHWVARIEDVTPHGFLDRQIQGPFARWEHRHIFQPVDAETTAVIDNVRAEFSDNLFWRMVGTGMWLTMRVLFAFRAWKTKRLLHSCATPALHDVT